MKKINYSALLLAGVLCVGAVLPTGAEPFFAQPAANRQLTQQINRADTNQQIATFIRQTAERNPAQFATALLGGKWQYVSNPEVIYIGIKDTDEVLVICKVDDTDMGTFYHKIHKKGYRTTEQDLSHSPSTHGFIALYRAD